MINIYLRIITLTLTMLILFCGSTSVKPLEVGDKLEYNYKFSYEENLLLSNLNTTIVECTITLEVNGIVIHEIDNIKTDTLTTKVSFRDFKMDYSVKCNDTATETYYRQEYEKTKMQINKTLSIELKKDLPLLVRLNETIGKIYPFTNPQSNPRYYYYSNEYSYNVIKTTYKDLPSLMIKTQVNTTRGPVWLYNETTNSNAVIYTDLIGNIVYYYIVETGQARENQTIETTMSQLSIIGLPVRTIKARFEMDLRNIDILSRYKATGLNIKFRNGKGEVYVSGYNANLNSYRVDGNKLILNITGSGLGGIFVNLTRNISLLDISVDGVRAKYISEEINNNLLIRAPVLYSNHIVVIEFSEEIIEETVVEPYPNLLVILIVITIIVSLVIYIRKRLKKRPSFQQ